MKKKILWIILVLSVIGILVGYDYYRSKQVVITVEKMNPEIVHASSSESVELTLKVTSKSGKAIAGHNIYALVIGGGSLKSFYEKTDQDGMVQFVYYPPDMAGYQEEQNVTLKFRDESNSVFVEIYPTTEYQMKLIRPDADNSNGMTVDDYLN